MRSIYDDDSFSMTYGRRLSRFLSRYEWYYPRANRFRTTQNESSSPPREEDPLIAKDPTYRLPTLESAWTYFEHITLPRYLYRSSDQDTFEKVEPGKTQCRTELYPVRKTNENELGDFGVGVGLYFNSVRLVAMILIVAGLINIWNIRYFKSDGYTSDSQKSLQFILQGSAICTDEKWMACPTCTAEQWEGFPPNTARFASATPNSTEYSDPLTFILVNQCKIGLMEGMVSYVSLIFIIFSFVVISRLKEKHEVVLDEAEQTTEDYSVKVRNPPSDAHDVNEWKDFFTNQFDDTHVTCCTVVLGNEKLLDAIVQRRRLELQLQNMIPPNVKFDKAQLETMVKSAPTVPRWKKWFQSDAQTIHAKISKVKAEIKELRQKKYGVTRVFCTFETESAQRQVLKKLSVGKRAIWNQETDALPTKHLFRGNMVLDVTEADEPSSIRWLDLDISLSVRIVQRIFTFTATFILIYAGALFIASVHKHSAMIAGFVISILDKVVPKVCSKITSFESHGSEGRRQVSQFIKVVAFRWVNTAIVMEIITPFTDTVSLSGGDNMIDSVWAIFFAEIVIKPAVQLGDIPGNFKRHVLAPRAVDQRRMNSYFEGGKYELGERHTRITTIVFLCFYYAALFPMGYFVGGFICIMTYYLDRFSILRTWKQAPLIGTQVSKFNRDYFMSIVLIALAVMSSYQWSGYPYDNACVEGAKVGNEYVGSHIAHLVDDNENDINIHIEQGSTNYKFCNQDLIEARVFPALSKFQPKGEEWMSHEQEIVVDIFGWTSVVVLVLVVLRILVVTFRRFDILSSAYVPTGEDQELNFSEESDIRAYVPQFRLPGFSYPLIACDLSQMDTKLVGWVDPSDKSYDKHNITHDILLQPDEDFVPSTELFSVTKHWSPPVTQPS